MTPTRFPEKFSCAAVHNSLIGLGSPPNAGCGSDGWLHDRWGRGRRSRSISVDTCVRIVRDHLLYCFPFAHPSAAEPPAAINVCIVDINTALNFGRISLFQATKSVTDAFAPAGSLSRAAAVVRR